jgi:hypothetical protein
MSIIGALGADAIGGIVREVGDVIDDLVTSDEERQAGELEAQKLDNQLLLGQQEINKVEAASASLFVAGARPYIMWICGTALGLIYIPQSLVKAWLWSYQAIVAVHYWDGKGVMPALPPYPDMGLSDLVTLLLALLGMSTMRHRETMAGTAREAPLTPFKVRNPFKRADPAQQEAP